MIPLKKKAGRRKPLRYVNIHCDDILQGLMNEEHPHKNRNQLKEMFRGKAEGPEALNWNLPSPTDNLNEEGVVMTTHGIICASIEILAAVFGYKPNG